MEKEENKLEKLKKDYSGLQKKYSLPSFHELNRDFHIEKIAENETDFLLREIRRAIGDKLAGYMRFVENLLNPVNVPMFVFSMVKILDASDKKRLSDVYKLLVKNEVEFIALDLEFDEEKESKFIKASSGLWKNTSRDVLAVMNKIKKKWDDKSEAGDKGYFG